MKKRENDRILQKERDDFYAQLLVVYAIMLAIAVVLIWLASASTTDTDVKSPIGYVTDALVPSTITLLATCLFDCSFIQGSSIVKGLFIFFTVATAIVYSSFASIGIISTISPNVLGIASCFLSLAGIIVLVLFVEFGNPRVRENRRKTSDGQINGIKR